MSSEGKEKWWFPLFRGLIRWLPELELLSPRICETCDSAFARMINPQLYEVDVGNLQWVGTFSSLSVRLGTPLSTEEVAKAYRGNLTAALLDRGWIKRDGDRFASQI